MHIGHVARPIASGLKSARMGIVSCLSGFQRGGGDAAAVGDEGPSLRASELGPILDVLGFGFGVSEADEEFVVLTSPWSGVVAAAASSDCGVVRSPFLVRNALSLLVTV